MVTKNKGLRSPGAFVAASWLFALSMFSVDTLGPDGYAEWMFYILPAGVISYYASRRTALISVSAFTILTALGWYLSSPGHLPPGIGIFNRVCGITVTWGISLGILLLRKRAAQIEEAAVTARENEFRLRAMFNNAAIGILEVDSRFRIVMANDRWCSILGYRREELTGKTIFDLTDPEDLQKTRELNAKLAEGEIKFINYEKRYNRRDGSPLWIHATVSAIRDSENRVRSYVGTLEDIDARKQAEELLQKSEVRYRKLFESMDEGFALCEMIFNEAGKPVDFRYLEINPAFSRLTGLQAERVIGRTAQEAIPGIEPSWIETYGRIVITGRSERIVNPILVLGRHFEVFAWRVENSMFAAVYSEVTMRILMEGELRQRAEELQLAVNELENFSYSIAHGLRTPLRAIVSFAQLIEQEGAGRLDDRCRDFIGRIRKAGSGIGKRMEELLDFSQLRSITMLRSDVDISAMATEIAGGFSKATPARKVDWRIESGLKTYGDPALLRRALYHLLDNAWKFTSKKDSAAIRFGKTIISGKEVFFIQDNGVGFSMAFGQSLFRPFSRLHSAEQYDGNGIGLAVVKRIIDRHRGAIWADAKMNAGTTIYFSLPARRFDGERESGERRGS
jgi:PAS domain S-box-containing protein